ncbi:MAG: hypothetical protein C4570_03425 [Ammonifex sp.]|jgi:hypothetical protein|nr:MAG: hypothetical protein C4570_03425 [Ammonifex sp.]
MANRWAQKFQFGVEAVNGTAVAADTMLLADPKALKPDRAPVQIPAALGVRGMSSDEVIYQYLVQDTLRFTTGYFQALPLLFSCGLRGGITPVEQTVSQADWLWAFLPSLTGSNALNSFTLEEGDDTQAYETEYCMFERLRISGQIAQTQGGESPVAIEVDYFGRQHTATTFTPALTAPSAEYMTAKTARLYLDTAWAGIGVTEKTGVLRGFDIEILTGAHPKMLGDANKYFNTHGQGFISAMMALTLERGATSDALWDAMRAKTFQAARLLLTGSQIGTGDNHSLSIDVGGIFTEAVPMAQEDRGNNIDTFVLASKYDATGAKILDVNVTTDVAAI